VHTADLLPSEPDGAQNVYTSLGRAPDLRALTRRSDVTLSAFFAFECPIVEPRLYAGLPALEPHLRRIYTFCDADQLGRFTGRPIRSRRFVWPQPADDIDEDAWRRTHRKFLAMINANKLPRLYDRELYTERLRAVEFFHRFGEIDLFGRGWSGAPMRVGRTWVPATLRRWGEALWLVRQRRRPDPLYAAVAAASRGPIDSKADTLSGYRFAICFENMILQGWITEKIFDCFRAGCIPIYLGAPEIGELVPPDAFIDMRRFSGYHDLRTFLHSLSDDQIERYRRAGREFMRSPAYDRFRPRMFAELFREIVREDTGC
jgi:hypothetical protein